MIFTLSFQLGAFYVLNPEYALLSLLKMLSLRLSFLRLLQLSILSPILGVGDEFPPLNIAKEGHLTKTLHILKSRIVRVEFGMDDHITVPWKKICNGVYEWSWSCIHESPLSCNELEKLDVTCAQEGGREKANVWQA
jgi:hypothetical protein